MSDHETKRIFLQQQGPSQSLAISVQQKKEKNHFRFKVCQPLIQKGLYQANHIFTLSFQKNRVPKAPTSDVECSVL